MEKPESLASCRCEACQADRPHNTDLELIIKHNWQEGGYEVFRQIIETSLNHLDETETSTILEPVAQLRDSGGFMFVFFLESIRPGFVSELRRAPMAPRLGGVWPADDYDGLYAEYYWQRFHRFPLKDPAKAEAEDLLKELGL